MTYNVTSFHKIVSAKMHCRPLLILINILAITHSVMDNSFQEPGLEQLMEKISPYKAVQRHSRVKRKFSKFLGSKSDIKAAVQDEFKEYEKCLTEREKERKSKSNTIHGMLALEGQKIRLSCNLCPRPDQELNKLEIVDWQRLRPQDSDFTFVNENGGRIRIDKGTRDLVLDPVDVLDAGQYFCINTYYREYEEIYQLDVLFRERLKTTKYEDVQNGKDKFLQTFMLTEHNLKAFTAWSDWTDCQECNKKSIRKRVGLCMVNKINPDLPILPYDLPVMELYPTGVPCRSTVLSKDLASIKRIKMRRSEVSLDSCYRDCPTTPGYTIITDETGNVSEIVEAGFYSLKSKPKLPPMIRRRVLFEPVNKHLILACPKGGKKSKALIRWRNSTIVLNPLTIRRKTRGRVFLDSINRLHIRRLRKSDSAPYNCWKSNIHIATIKVIVTDASNDMKVKEIITYTGLCLTVFSIFLICVCTLCKKKKKTAK